MKINVWDVSHTQVIPAEFFKSGAAHTSSVRGDLQELRGDTLYLQVEDKQHLWHFGETAPLIPIVLVDEKPLILTFLVMSTAFLDVERLS